MERRKRLSLKQRRAIVEAQNGRCAMCGDELVPGSIEYDHTQALVHGGDNDVSNFRALDQNCHKTKTRRDVHARNHADAIAFGKPKKSRPMDGSRESPFKRKMNGTVERRE